MPYTSDRRIWLNADKTKVVEDGSADAAFLLVGEGGQLSDEEAEQYGLTKQPEKAKAEQPNKAKAPAENKAAK